MGFPGRFFVFCGLDGSGKTTQLKLLAQALEDAKFSTCLTSEPTAWYLKDSFVQNYFGQGQMDEYRLAALALFSAADRARHLSEVILPNLNEGKIVISSRYVFSTYAYFFGRGLRDQVWLATINRYSIEPDLTIFLDLEPEAALDRIAKRGDKPKREELDISRLREIRQQFLTFASNRFRVFDASQDTNELHKKILSLAWTILQQIPP
jgi:dTMP kinase